MSTPSPLGDKQEAEGRRLRLWALWSSPRFGLLLLCMLLAWLALGTQFPQDPLDAVFAADPGFNVDRLIERFDLDHVLTSWVLGLLVLFLVLNRFAVELSRWLAGRSPGGAPGGAPVPWQGVPFVEIRCPGRSLDGLEVPLESITGIRSYRRRRQQLAGDSGRVGLAIALMAVGLVGAVALFALDAFSVQGRVVMDEPGTAGETSAVQGRVEIWGDSGYLPYGELEVECSTAEAGRVDFARVCRGHVDGRAHEGELAVGRPLVWGDLTVVYHSSEMARGAAEGGQILHVTVAGERDGKWLSVEQGRGYQLSAAGAENSVQMMAQGGAAGPTVSVVDPKREGSYVLAGSSVVASVSSPIAVRVATPQRTVLRFYRVSTPWLLLVALGVFVLGLLVFVGARHIAVVALPSHDGVVLYVWSLNRPFGLDGVAAALRRELAQTSTDGRL